MKKFIKNILKNAGDIILSQADTIRFIEFKKKDNLVDFNQIVTEQDLIIEKFIISKIKERYPNHNIISEEKNDNDFSLQNPTWVIDPIDGTMNYSRNINHYCISLAYWENNSAKYGGVYSPLNDELFYAEADSGATLNGKEIYVSKKDQINESIILLSGYNSFKKNNTEKAFINLVSHIKNTRILSSSILDMCYVASGRCEGRIYSSCKFWDLSSAKLILEEAGGKVTNWKDNTNDYFSPFIVASNGLLHNSLIKLINV